MRKKYQSYRILPARTVSAMGPRNSESASGKRQPDPISHRYKIYATIPLLNRFDMRVHFHGLKLHMKDLYFAE